MFIANLLVWLIKCQVGNIHLKLDTSLEDPKFFQTGMNGGWRKKIYEQCCVRCCVRCIGGGGGSFVFFAWGRVRGGGGGIVSFVSFVYLYLFFLHLQEYCSYLLFILSYHRLLLVKNSPRTRFNDPNDQADDVVDDDDDDA